MDEKILIGLIGYPVSHSASPQIFQRIFDNLNLSNWEYQLFPMEHLMALDKFIEEQPTLVGFNVTVPHKINILSHLKSLSPQAQAIGAVNTVKITRNAGSFTLEGHNTDYFGFEETLKMLPRKPKSCIILGDGGAARAVKAVFTDYKIDFKTVSRTPKNGQISYESLDSLNWNEVDLIVNTTPLGMHPNVEFMPYLPIKLIGSQTMAIDLIYNPKQTLFLKNLELNGCFCVNGELMLQKQAEKAWEIFYHT